MIICQKNKKRRRHFVVLSIYSDEMLTPNKMYGYLKKTMWTTDSFWFEIAIVSAIYAAGNITFGHFEEHTPKIRRISKYFLTIIIIITLSNYLGRVAAMSILGLCFIPIIYIHGIVLPQKGINGLTAEPKEKYYELRAWNKDKLYKKNS